MWNKEEDKYFKNMEFCYQTLTKIKFIFIDYQTNMEKCNKNIGKIYDVYSDLMAKNPNYELDIPIDVASFNERVKIFG